MMEFLELTKKFWEFYKINKISPSSTTLYLCLLNIWDNNEQKDFELSDYEISKNLGISRKTIKNSKENLRNLGLISFRVRSGYSTCYKIISDYSLDGSKEKVIAEKKETKTKNIVTLSTPKKENNLVSETNKQVTDKQVTDKQVTDKQVDKKATNQIDENTLIGNELESSKKAIQRKQPTFEEFMDFAKTIEIYTPELDYHLKAKYEQWEASGWRNGYGKFITNWKSSLKNTIPYMTTTNAKKEEVKIPKINRPKNTYNE